MNPETRNWPRLTLKTEDFKLLPDAELVQATRQGDRSAFEELVRRHQPRVFATARRYARRESEIEDIVQESFIKAFQKLDSFRGEAPFEHWLMRLTVRTCFDSLRAHQRNRETSLSQFTDEQEDWLDRFATDPSSAGEDSQAARQLVQALLDELSPAARLVIQLLEIEEKSVKEIAALTGWSVPLVKVRAFRARAEMRKALARLERTKFL